MQVVRETPLRRLRRERDQHQLVVAAGGLALDLLAQLDGRLLARRRRRSTSSAADRPSRPAAGRPPCRPRPRAAPAGAWSRPRGARAWTRSSTSPSAIVSSVGASVAVTCGVEGHLVGLRLRERREALAGCVRISSRKLGTLPPMSVPPLTGRGVCASDAAGRRGRRAPCRRGSFAASLLTFQDSRLDHRLHQHGRVGFGALHPDRGQGSNRTASSVAARARNRT